MENNSTFTTFILTHYEPMAKHKYFYFTFFLLIYIVSIVLNTSVIAIVYKERTLHEPMYIFISNLACNGIYGSTALQTHIMGKLITQSYTISLSNCFLQIFSLHTFCIVELMVLAIMGYDRYAAICTPLHYHAKMSPRRVKIFIAVAWLFPFCSFALYLSLTIRLSFCGNVIAKTYCTNFDLIRLSCTDTTVNNFVGVVLLGVYLFPQFFVILFSYGKILTVCLHASKECQKKALRTCIPHLLTVINYFFAGLFELIQVRIKANQFPYEVAVFMSLYFVILSPLLNPVVYGSSVLKVHVRQLFQRKISPGLSEKSCQH